MKDLFKPLTSALAEALSSAIKIPPAVGEAVHDLLWTTVESLIDGDKPEVLAQKAIDQVIKLKNVQLAHDEHAKRKFPGFRP